MARDHDDRRPTACAPNSRGEHWRREARGLPTELVGCTATDRAALARSGHGRWPSVGSHPGRDQASTASPALPRSEARVVASRRVRRRLFSRLDDLRRRTNRAFDLRFWFRVAPDLSGHFWFSRGTFAGLHAAPSGDGNPHVSPLVSGDQRNSTLGRVGSDREVRCGTVVGT